MNEKNILRSFGLDIQKGGKKTGTYQDNAENRKLGRVGQKYTQEAKDADNVYHNTYSSAVQYAREQAEKKYEVDEDDWWKQVSTGQGKPSGGKTISHSIGLTDKKTGKTSKKNLQIQVYNMGHQRGKTFELNWYIN